MPNPDGTMTQQEIQQLLAAATAANQGLNVGPTPGASPSPSPSPSPTPAPAATPQPGLLTRFLSAIMPSTKSLAAPQPTGGITAEQLWQQQHPGQPFPGGR